MTASEQLAQFAAGSKALPKLCREYKKESATVHLKELVGGALSFYAAAAVAKTGGVHIFVAEDRDAAAYLLNDFYNLLDEKQVYFFPSSYKRSAAYGAEDAQGVVQRTAAMNAVRKRLSAVKGGRFAQHCAPARVVSILLSDVLGDRPDVIGSGPAVPDPSTSGEALEAAAQAGLLPDAALEALLRQETPKLLENARWHVVGGVRLLCAAAEETCRRLGYAPFVLTDRLSCEAREAGSFLGSIVRTHAGQGKKLAYIAGGETVVHLTGKGLGGRNQELALAAAPALAGLDAAVFSVGSDGTDGPTDAAGGYVDGDTLSALTAKGWNVFDTLQNNDAYHALKAVDGLIMTGATGTNVNDVAVALVGEK